MDVSDLTLPDLIPDVKVSQLNAAEQLIIGTLRLCALDVKAGGGTGLDWHDGLLTAGVAPCGVVAFGMFVQVLLI